MNTDSVRKDQSDETMRRFEVYTRSHRLTANDIFHLTDAELAEIFRVLDESPEDYPIPVTEPEYLYHGTAKARLHLIVEEGLVPSVKSRHAKTVGVGEWSLGKVFFADTVSSAMWYAKHASKTNPALVRVSIDTLDDRVPDDKEEDGCFYVSRAVDAAEVEVWQKSGWTPLIENNRTLRR